MRAEAAPGQARHGVGTNRGPSLGTPLLVLGARDPARPSSQRPKPQASAALSGEEQARVNVAPGIPGLWLQDRPAPGPPRAAAAWGPPLWDCVSWSPFLCLVGSLPRCSSLKRSVGKDVKFTLAITRVTEATASAGWPSINLSHVRWL